LENTIVIIAGYGSAVSPRVFQPVLVSEKTLPIMFRDACAGVLLKPPIELLKWSII
jgi:hypothetical protein